MSTHPALAFGFVLSLSIVSQAATGDVVTSFPSSFPSPDGLMWDGTNLWATDCSSERIDKVDPATGSVIGNITIPRVGSDEMAWDGKQMWVSDHSATEMPGMGAPPPRIYRVDPAEGGSVLGYFDAPGDSKYPMGVAWDGQKIWNVDTWDKKIYQLEPETGEKIRSIPAPADGSCGMTWDGACLWLSDASTNGVVYHLDPATGDIITSFPGPGGPGHQSTGIAWDGKNLWVHDEAKGKATIYKLEIDDITEGGRCAGAYIAPGQDVGSAGGPGNAGAPGTPNATGGSTESNGCSAAPRWSSRYPGAALAILGALSTMAARRRR